MTARKRSTVVGMFEDRRRAEEAVHALKQAGFRDEQIGLVRRGEEKEIHAGGTHAAEGAVAGAAAGAGVAALVSLGMSFGVIPVIGPILAVGPLAAALLSAAGGAAAAGMVGALVGMGIPEEEALFYEREVHGGRTMVTVTADGRAEEAWAILARYGAFNRQSAATGTARTAERGETMRLHEEELHAHKRPVTTGEVRVRKDVVTEHKTLEVPVQREEVVIERHPATGRASSGDIRPGEEIRIPVKEERVDVHKHAVVKEEVTVGKRQVQDTEQVSGTVRKEQVKVEREGDVEVHGTSATDAGKAGRKKGRKT
jgi:uncharacterized protein (TIGR02271 family)